MKSRAVKEKLAVGASVVIIAAAVWFWALQIGSVIETLRLASG
jgi:hypothetical protein